MKRTKRPTPILLPMISKEINLATSSKHNLRTSQDPPNNTKNNNCFVVGEPQRLKVYLPKTFFVAKGLLEEVEVKEKTFVPSKVEMQKESVSLNVKYNHS
jgi:hypothetical protein